MTALAVRGGDVVGAGGRRRTTVRIDGGRISGVGDDVEVGDAEVLDASGAIVAPGFIDLQCNGAGGFDLTSDPASIRDVAALLPRFGVTAFCPTVVTSPRATRAAAIRECARARSRTDGSTPLGLHLEGPLLHPDHAGAHDPTQITVPDADEVGEWVGSGVVRMVTLAPERPGALDVVRRLTAAGVLVAAGHTAMTTADLSAARRAGLAYATHLYNAMSRFHHRDGSAVGAVLADDGIVAGLICDGVHVAPDALRVARRALGPDRVSLVSDASAALGEPAGTVRLGRHDVTSDERGVRLADGTLAGSALALDAAVRNYVELAGAPVDEALAAVTTVPAGLLQLPDRGRIEVGARGDLTLLDHDLRAVATVIGGRVAWRS